MSGQRGQEAGLLPSQGVSGGELGAGPGGGARGGAGARRWSGGRTARSSEQLEPSWRKQRPGRGRLCSRGAETAKRRRVAAGSQAPGSWEAGEAAEARAGQRKEASRPGGEAGSGVWQ